MFYQFEYFKGESVSYNDWAGPVVFESDDDDSAIETMELSYDIEAIEDKYRITIAYKNPNNVGIYSSI